MQVPPQIFDTGKCEPRITRCQLLCDIPLKRTSISFTCVRVGIVTVNPVPTCTMKTCSNCVSADFRPKLVWWFAESSSLGKFEADLSIVCAIDACGSHAACGCNPHKHCTTDMPADLCQRALWTAHHICNATPPEMHRWKTVKHLVDFCSRLISWFGRQVK